MFWKEEITVDQFQVPSDVVDLVFDINCRELPVDHAYALSNAIMQVLPWLKTDNRIGIHSIHVAGSQNGWERPSHSTQSRLLLSQRTKLVLRIPIEHKDHIQSSITGTILDISGCLMRVGNAKIRQLSKHTTIFARYVVSVDIEEEVFLEWVAKELQNMGISIRKALCGKSMMLAMSTKSVVTRSLLLADLSLEESVRLQKEGLGDYRIFGCGLFLPHKGINAVAGTG